MTVGWLAYNKYVFCLNVSKSDARVGNSVHSGSGQMALHAPPVPPISREWGGGAMSPQNTQWRRPCSFNIKSRDKDVG